MSLLFPRMSALAPYHSLNIGPTRNEWGPLFDLFNDTLGEMHRTTAEKETAIQSFMPRFDVREERHSYHLEGEMPGIAQEDIEIVFSDERTLTVKGRSERYQEKGQRPKQLESATSAITEQNNDNQSTEVHDTERCDRCSESISANRIYVLDERAKCWIV